jgi:hypothetical protein
MNITKKINNNNNLKTDGVLLLVKDKDFEELTKTLRANNNSDLIYIYYT